MYDDILDTVQHLTGIEGQSSGPSPLQAAIRTVLIYAGTLLIVRLGSIRFLSKATAFDVVVGIMLGSIMSRATNGSAALSSTFAAGVVLVGMHWLFARLAYHTDWFGPAVKGDRLQLIKDGEIQDEAMQKASITHNDLEEALRLQTRETDPSKIKQAYLERNGQISAVPFSRSELEERGDMDRQES